MKKEEEPWQPATSTIFQDATLDLRLYAREPGELDQEFQEDAEAKKDVQSRVFCEETTSGAISPSERKKQLKGSYIVSGIVYG